MRTSKDIAVGTIFSILLSLVTVFIVLVGCERWDPEEKLIVKTRLVSDITFKSCVVTGELIALGSESVTQHGFCFSNNSNPTIEDNTVRIGLRSNTGNFSSLLSGLQFDTKYFVKAFATDSSGTKYGEELEFYTLTMELSVTDYDGNIYSTVEIGSQVWMQENLRVTHYSDGSEIPLVRGTLALDALEAGDKAYSWPEGIIEDMDVYGGLYTWAAAMNGNASSDLNPSNVQGVCPDGWHLPSDAEWKQLEMFLGMTQVDADGVGWRGTNEGDKLKQAGSTHWQSPNTRANNSSGFTALPGGTIWDDGAYWATGQSGCWWSSTKNNTNSIIWKRLLLMEHSEVNRFDNNSFIGNSVRCIKD